MLGRIIDIEPKHRHGVIFVTTALWASRRVAGSAFGTPWESMMVISNPCETSLSHKQASS